jgi:predicted RNase H-like HicB family nuclease
MINYTAKDTKIASGYMGQLGEWPEVVTEGKDLENCRSMLRDALNEMILSYNELGKDLPNLMWYSSDNRYWNIHLL